MIEGGGSYAGAYYYHFDGLGSVVALSDADGETVQTYEYSVYGEPAASDPNHPNPYLFTGRRFDPETGLYHYRARAYNPYIGRFLQTDPAREGMNWYAYCRNAPVGYTDPYGLCAVCGVAEPCTYPSVNGPNWVSETGRIMVLPEGWDPFKLGNVKGLVEYLEAYQKAIEWKGRIGVAVDIWKGNWGGIAKDAITPDPLGSMTSFYVDALKRMCEGLLGLSVGGERRWRVFIEVQYRWWLRAGDAGPDYASDGHGFALDKEGNRILMRDKPYWVEVTNLNTFIPEKGYKTAEDAFKAGMKGIHFWGCHMLGRAVPRGWWTDYDYAAWKMYSDKTYTYSGEIPEFSPD
jgi:RHS repeat-associated protein